MGVKDLYCMLGYATACALPQSHEDRSLLAPAEFTGKLIGYRVKYGTRLKNGLIALLEFLHRHIGTGGRFDWRSQVQNRRIRASDLRFAHQIDFEYVVIWITVFHLKEYCYIPNDISSLLGD